MPHVLRVIFRARASPLDTLRIQTPWQLLRPLCAKCGYCTESQMGYPLSVLGYLGLRYIGRDLDVEAQVVSRLSISKGGP